MVTPERLLADYSEWRLFTSQVSFKQKQGVYIRRRLAMTSDRREHLSDLLSFCFEHQLDPRRYLYSLFSRRKWVASPPFYQLVPASHRKKRIKEVIDYYNNIPDIDRFSSFMLNELQSVREQNGNETFNANRDLDYGAEVIKKRYVSNGDADRCYDEMIERTFGFHPRSLVCARCPLAKKCEQTLRALTPSFDIVALRMTADPGPAHYGRQ